MVDTTSVLHCDILRIFLLGPVTAMTPLQLDDPAKNRISFASDATATR
jgi:hypothetical protein